MSVWSDVGSDNLRHVNCYPRVIHTYILQVHLAMYIMYISSVRRFISASLDLDVVSVFALLMHQLNRKLPAYDRLQSLWESPLKTRSVALSIE